ncbi:MAG TPA: hypothetical protein PLY54_05950, partial [Ottowia sp.]|nr:hypothetical protein [Ottowia sp.]
RPCVGDAAPTCPHRRRPQLSAAGGSSSEPLLRELRHRAGPVEHLLAQAGDAGQQVVGVEARGLELGGVEPGVALPCVEPAAGGG